MSRTRILIVTLGLAVTGLVGYGLAQVVLPNPAIRGSAPITASQQRPAAAPSIVEEASSSPGPARTVAGIPEGFTRSALGAVAAASSYLAVLEQTLAAGSARWAAAVRALTRPPLTGQALLAQKGAQVVADRVSSATAPTFIGGWRLGYRIDAYTPSRARVQVWTAGVMAGGAGVVAPEYSTSLCRLRWLGGDWKLTAAQSTPGPTPPSDGTDRRAVSAFAKSALGFEPFRDAP